MGFRKKTIRDIKLDDKCVLVSVDYNVPGNDQGEVTDDYRIKASLPTLKYLLEKKCRIVLISHRGRPDGKVVPKFSLRPVAPILSKLIGKEVQFEKDCIGPVVKQTVSKLKPGQILLLENTRFHAGEEANDSGFAAELANGCQVFVQDAFGNAHRNHASISGVAKLLPAVAGLLLEQEVDTITDVMEKPQRPLMAIVGGAKIADKIDIIKRFIEIADIVVIGGAMSNTFLLAQGVKIGKSMADKTDLPLAKDILEKARTKAKKEHFIFYLPQDGVVAKRVEEHATTRIVDWDAHVIAEVENYPKRPPRESAMIKADEMILDIGPFSGAFIAGATQLCETVVWNGAMGVTEVPALQGAVGPFAHGTELVIDALIGEYGHQPFTLVGGGDTAAYLAERHMTSYFNHVSTGGGASLELMAGKKLPGVEALQNKGK